MIMKIQSIPFQVILSKINSIKLNETQKDFLFFY